MEKILNDNFNEKIFDHIEKKSESINLIGSKIKSESLS